MKDKDSLLAKARSLAQNLKGVDSSEFKKVTQFFIRNRDIKELRKLLQYNPPPRGGSHQYWRRIKERLDKPDLEKFTTDELGYIFGWTFRFMKYQGD